MPGLLFELEDWATGPGTLQSLSSQPWVDRHTLLCPASVLGISTKALLLARQVPHTLRRRCSPNQSSVTYHEPAPPTMGLNQRAWAQDRMINCPISPAASGVLADCVSLSPSLIALGIISQHNTHRKIELPFKHKSGIMSR